jgi:hypothetical protein
VPHTKSYVRGPVGTADVAQGEEIGKNLGEKLFPSFGVVGLAGAHIASQTSGIVRYPGFLAEDFVVNAPA